MTAYLLLIEIITIDAGKAGAPQDSELHTHMEAGASQEGSIRS